MRALYSVASAFYALGRADQQAHKTRLAALKLLLFHTKRTRHPLEPPQVMALTVRRHALAGTKLFVLVHGAALHRHQRTAQLQKVNAQLQQVNEQLQQVNAQLQ